MLATVQPGAPSKGAGRGAPASEDQPLVVETDIKERHKCLGPGRTQWLSGFMFDTRPPTASLSSSKDGSTAGSSMSSDSSTSSVSPQPATPSTIVQPMNGTEGACQPIDLPPTDPPLAPQCNLDVLAGVGASRPSMKAKRQTVFSKMGHNQSWYFKAQGVDGEMTFGADAALTRLEQEAASREPGWRIAAKLVLPAPWNPEWKAGSWISNRMGQHAKALAHRARMTEEQRQRLDALPYGEITPDTDAVLTRLEQEAALRGAGWRIAAKLVLPAPWNPEWKAGSWISNRAGQHAKALAHRARMTEEQRQRLDALPYGH